MSRAARFHQYGPPEVLSWDEVDLPEPGPGQVRVRVRVAGVQPFDIKLRRGDLAAQRPVRFPAQVGNEYAGTVDAWGPGVSGPPIGQEVAGSVNGTGCAEYVLAPVEDVVPKPAGLDLVTAGALVAAAQTASGALGILGVGPGDTLLAHAAAGSVGTVAVQLAREIGATVIGTASDANHDYLRTLGAIAVRYGEGLVDRVRKVAPQGVSVVLDAIGGEALAASAQLVADPSRIGTIADPAGAARYGARLAFAPRSPARLAEVLALAEAGKLVMPVETFPGEQIAAAHRRTEGGHVRGKVVVLI
ncbi:NADP-dependent oxidoreductase [Dactylosporangium sp. NPDC051485]|uniref:NADP-dependent oxidoreductase n=1 Tax=Dactylosporangium sp. NPDC051485 TaxID=3154846 RepID=UPI0034282C7A